MQAENKDEISYCGDHCRKMRLWLPSLVSLQDGTSAEGQSKTKQESAWLFRLWYTFDHKYPFCALPYRNKKVRHSLLEAQLFELAEHSRQCELSYLPRTIVYNLFVLLPALCSLCNNWCPYWIMTYEGHKVNAFSSSSFCFLPFAQQLPLQVADCVAAFHYYSCVLQWRLSPRSHVLDTAETSGGIVSHCQRYASCRERVQCDTDLFRVSLLSLFLLPTFVSWQLSDTDTASPKKFWWRDQLGRSRDFPSVW